MFVDCVLAGICSFNNTCKNNATCIDDLANLSFKCRCPLAFVGRLCEFGESARMIWTTATATSCVSLSSCLGLLYCIGVLLKQPIYPDSHYCPVSSIRCHT